MRVRPKSVAVATFRRHRASPALTLRPTRLPRRYVAPMPGSTYFRLLKDDWPWVAATSAGVSAWQKPRKSTTSDVPDAPRASLAPTWAASLAVSVVATVVVIGGGEIASLRDPWLVSVGELGIGPDPKAASSMAQAAAVACVVLAMVQGVVPSSRGRPALQAR